jgi:hypothetical protein
VYEIFPEDEKPRFKVLDCIEIPHAMTFFPTVVFDQPHRAIVSFENDIYVWYIDEEKSVCWRVYEYCCAVRLLFNRSDDPMIDFNR